MFSATTRKHQHCFGTAGRELGREGLAWTVLSGVLTPSTSQAPVTLQCDALLRQSTSCCTGVPGWAVRHQQGKLCHLRRIRDKSHTQLSAGSEHPNSPACEPQVGQTHTTSGVQQHPAPRGFTTASSQRWEPQQKHRGMLGAQESPQRQAVSAASVPWSTPSS